MYTYIGIIYIYQRNRVLFPIPPAGFAMVNVMSVVNLELRDIYLSLYVYYVYLIHISTLTFVFSCFSQASLW